MRTRLTILIGILLIAVLGLAAGCPKGESAPPAQSVSGTPAPAAAPADNGAAAAETDAAPAESGAGEVEAEGDNADDTEDISQLPRPAKPAGEPSLEGEWFALFGETEFGPVQTEWISGHRVEFRKNGQAFWVKVDDGAQTATMDSQWSREGNKIRLSFSPARAVESGIAGVSPLGIGKDEEIGLASGNAPGGPASAMSLLDEILSYKLDHNFLVLTDSNNRMYTYGRVRQDADKSASALDGEWLGYFSRAEAVPAEFAMKDGGLTIAFTRERTVFNGQPSGNYFVGRIGDTGGSDYAALTITADGQLDGAIMRKPYREVEMDWEFVRAAE